MKRRIMCFLLSLILILTSMWFAVPVSVQASETVIKNYDYTGSVQVFEATQAGEYTLEVWGAQGGTGYTYVGGNGGYSKGTITLQKGDILYIQVGGKGTDTGTSHASTGTLKAGGYNGGGQGAYNKYSYEDSDGSTISYITYAGAGGGGTDIRIGQNSLYARVIVAGGGSGGCSLYGRSGIVGYVGGGTRSEGYNSTYWATQTSAGSGGSFGKGAGITNASSYKYVSGAGGGGWYGGGTYKSSSSSNTSYMGGGSGYVYTSSTASNYPSGCLLNSSYYLADTTIVDGATSFTSPTGSTETGHSGNGYARITYVKEDASTSFGETTVLFSYTGTAQIFIVPETGEYTLEVWGAQGGTGYDKVGGNGGYSKGTVTLQKGDILYIQVGGKGTDTGTSHASTGTLKAGGYNGGGQGAYNKYSYEDSDGSTISYITYAGAGGGGTDIRIGQNSLYARVIVAGGGSGGCSLYGRSGIVGYVGGGTRSEGYNSTYWATQTSAGSGGSFGKGAGITNASSSKYVSGAGGGGWYGGGTYKYSSSSNTSYMGGGSGYVYTSSTASNYPSGCLLNSSYYLTDTDMFSGYAEFLSPTGSMETGHSGDGYAKISYNKKEKDPSKITTVFQYTSATSQTYTVPQTGTYLLEVWGAQGGTGYDKAGGKGGYSRGKINLTKDEILYINVGGKGTDTGTTYSTTSTIKAGGYNGGGNGAYNSYSYQDSDGSTISYITYASAGGGGTDIRIGEDSLYARVIVAGGGSGTVGRVSTIYSYAGGGETSDAYTSLYQATQTKAGKNGSFGQGGGLSRLASYIYVGAGGGGGWYGGGGGEYGSSDQFGSGGGSGYVYTSSTASNYPSGCLLNSSYYMTSAYTISGSGVSFPSTTEGSTEVGHAGNGYAKISLIVEDEDPPTVTFETNGVSSYVGTASTKVTVTDESSVDATSLKYQWTESTTAPEESTFTQSFTNGDTLTLSGQNGTWYLWILAADTLGNKNIVGSNAFFIDGIAPVGTISFESKADKNGTKYSDENQVTIRLAVADNVSSAENMQVALINEENYSETNPNSEIQWIDFENSKTWTLSSGEGLKKVYVIFKDEAGNQSVYLAM